MSTEKVDTDVTAVKEASSRKRSNTIAAIIIALLVLLLGAFAWGVFQNAINQVFNEVGPSALLVDIFAPADDDGEWDKEIRVQNTGTVPFVARIRIDEFMQINEGGFQGIENEFWENVLGSTLPTATRDWSFFDEDSGQLLNQNITDVDTTLLATPTVSVADAFTMIFDIPSGVDGDANAWSIYGRTPLALPNATPGAFGSHRTEPPVDPMAMGNRIGDVFDITLGNPFANYFEWNLPNVMTFADWDDLAANDPGRYDVWVLCDDGYFYYVAWIIPQNLLEEGVPAGSSYLGLWSDQSLDLMDGFVATSSWYQTVSFYYAINANMEVVSRDDIEAMINGEVPRFGSELPFHAADGSEGDSGDGQTILEWLDANWPF
ncbi:MAG: hypothetical protein FWG78_03300 [Coriobacteriia bacterium]|nr:hypothetical protein [Coriobacteriia bacterium]